MSLTKSDWEAVRAAAEEALSSQLARDLLVLAMIDVLLEDMNGSRDTEEGTLESNTGTDAS